MPVILAVFISDVSGMVSSLKGINTMKLFAWQPNGHGEMSMFVMAKDKEAAEKAIQSKIDSCKADIDGMDFYLDFSGWKTTYYTLTELEEGEVVLNDND